MREDCLCAKGVMMKLAGAVKILKEGKLPSVDKIAVENLKKGGVFVLEWLVRHFNAL